MGTIYFSLHNIMPVVMICAGVSVVAMMWLLLFYRLKVNCVAKYSRKSEDEPAEYPAVSVIVYACDNSKTLAAMLPSVLEQDYPAPMEVIVVNDGSSSDVTDVVKLLSLNHKNLYITFIPDKAQNLSRKKLAISLGVKAAKNPYVIMTCAECRVESNRWLRHMAAPFAKGKDVVLGYAGINRVKGKMNLFDEVLTATVWLSAAIGGKPYRGMGYNLGYKRSLYFDTKGFAKSLTLHHGDDDIFINQIANGENTEVVLTPEAVINVEYYNPEKELREMRMSHCFTGRFLPKCARRMFGFSAVMMWLWLAATVVGIVFSLPNALPALLFVVTIPLVWIPLVLTWRKTGKALGVKLGAWTLPFMMLFRGFRNLKYKLMCGRASRRNYTWLQH